MGKGHLKSWITGILTWLLLFLVAFPVSCAGSWIVLQAIGIHHAKREVTGVTPDMFPILVMTPQPGSSTPKAQIVYQKDLEEFLTKNPQHSYLVPAGMEASLQNQLMQQSSMNKNPSDSGTPPWSASFEVERLPNGHQLLEVDAPPYDDLPDTGWYEATDKEVIPRYHKTYSELGMSMGASFLAAPVAVVPGILLATLGFWILRRMRRTKAQPPAPVVPAPPPPLQ
ncbi:MAG TPA: hypothetical protein VGQ94_06715 [Terriglobales bacterium]|nr:hypothetical protein [Terriglobales bacterium]